MTFQNLLRLVEKDRSISFLVSVDNTNGVLTEVARENRPEVIAIWQNTGYIRMYHPDRIPKNLHNATKPLDVLYAKPAIFFKVSQTN